VTELWRRSATEIAGLIRRREVSALEVTRDALQRIESVNAAINAIVDHRPDEALTRAAEIDQSLARGENPGPLAGVPVTIKVNLDQNGYPTTNGLRLQRDLIAHEDNPGVENIRKAGAVFLGRTNTPAFSYRWFTNNLLHGATVNPRRPGLTPGGSSGGAGAAVAAGMGALALGTDIAGSVRYPAYACGVHGLRPSTGRVPAFNASGPERAVSAQLMSVTGPLARSVADIRLGLQVLAAGSARDPFWVPAPLSGPEAPRKAALCPRPDGLDTAPEIIEHLQQSASRLRGAGWQVQELDALPPMKEAVALQLRLWMGNGYAAQLAAAEKEGDAGALTALRGQRKLAESMTLDNFANTFVQRATLMRSWQMFLQEWPVVLMPASAELPFPDNLDLQGEAAYRRVWEAQLPQIAIPLLGLPALALATGQAGTSPVGIQIVAGRFREDLCLSAGEAIEHEGHHPQAVDPIRQNDGGSPA